MEERGREKRNNQNKKTKDIKIKRKGSRYRERLTEKRKKARTFL